MNLALPTSILKGIGEKKTKILEKINIRTIEDLIHYYPRDYEIRKDLSPINQIVVGEVYLIEGIVSQSPQNMKTKNMIMTKMKIKDDTGEVLVTWYRQPYMKNNFKAGQKVFLKGKVVMKYGSLQLESPRVVSEEEIRATSSQQLLPIYPLIKDISLKMITDFIRAGVNYTGGQLKDYLPIEIRQEYDLCEYNYALNQIHNPIDELALEVARKRLIFDEFLLFQLGLQMLKSESFVIENQYEFKSENLTNELLNQLPYQLTNAQKRVLNEVIDNMKSHKTMNRLIQGDVGSGKTVIAALSLLLAVENGYQSTMMAPTEVLAKQHYKSLVELIEPLGIKIGLLVGSMSKKQKEEVYQKIDSGELGIVVGTHAIIQEGVKFKNLALVITDEQHRFGVKQREKLAGKGHKPHVLVMSATPIPRTLALIVYGDMDVSIIDELPPGRQNIKTYSVDTSFRERIYKFMEKEISQGRQCYIVCPMVEENEDLVAESVIEYTDKLKSLMIDSVRMTYLHGKMKPKDKNLIMEKFSDGEIDLLVSTTVIEVGVNVPNATIMLIENSDRFGLAGLHQLRGRVGRGIHQSHCILVTDSKADITKQRMKVMEKYTDGFIISEYDLKLRGPGDAFGIKQHGLPEFRIGNLFENTDILKSTHDLAVKIIEQDQELVSETYKYLGEKMILYFKNHVEQISL